MAAEASRVKVTAVRAAVMSTQARGSWCVAAARMGFPVRKVCGHDGLLLFRTGPVIAARYRQVRPGGPVPGQRPGYPFSPGHAVRGRSTHSQPRWAGAVGCLVRLVRW